MVSEFALHVGVGSVAALAAGLAGSVHCALMCGPLAAAAGPRLASLGWHVGRFGAYLLVGALLGATGGGLARAVAGEVHAVLPWLMALGLAASGFELGRRLPRVPALSAVVRGFAAVGARLGRVGRSVALGAVTPLLPCGLLWGLFLVAAGAGTAAGGALVMGAFAVGSTPGLAAVQLGIARLGGSGRLSSRAVLWIRRGVPIAAAAIIVVRALTIDVVGPTGQLCH